MKRYRTFLTIFAVTIIPMLLFGCKKDNTPPASSTSPPASSAQSETASILSQASESPADITPSTVFGEVIVTFDYKKQSGYASNQFAVWIEDAEGNFIKTLYATRFTANGGYRNRPDSISTWVEKSGLAAMTKTEVDAITGATPKAGTLSYTWDLTDTNGNAVSPGEYRFFVEGSLRWKNRVLYSGTIEIGDVDTTARADAQFFYEAGDNQPALSDDSPETAMIDAVSAKFSHAAGN